LQLSIQDPKKLLNFFLDISGNNSKDITYMKNLIDAYPNVLDYMMNNEMPNLSNVQYVKYKRYTALKEKVVEHYHLLELNEWLSDCFNFTILKRLYDHFAERQLNKKDINKLIVKAIKTQPYDTLCKLTNIAFMTADRILLNAYNKNPKLWDVDLSSSVYRCTSFIIWYLLNQLNGSTFTWTTSLKKQMSTKYDLSECINVFETAIQDVRIKLLSDNRIMLTSVYMEEQNISNFIKQGLDSFYKDNWNIDVNKYSSLNGFDLTDDQIKTLSSVNNNQLTLLNGYAGTGKSSSIKALINMLEDNNKSYYILAPTAKAAKTISKYTERQASTIHYALCNDFPDFDFHLDENDFQNVSELDNFKDVKCGIINADIVIIDESSMLSVSLFNLLIRYIDFRHNKVLMIGDSYQLPSIQHGNLYHDLLSLSDISKVTLNEIFRYTEDGLINVATNIRTGSKYLTNDKVQEIGNSYKYFEAGDTEQTLIAALEKYVELVNLYGIEDVAILTAKNIGSSGTYLLNNCIQQAINPLQPWDDELKIKLDDTEIAFRKNDVIMNIKNNYNAIPIGSDRKTLIANGQTGIIKNVNVYNQSLLLLIDDKEYEWQYKDCRNLRLGYAFTIHKSQGSQFKNVIYIITHDDMWMTSSNLMYVAVTRAQEVCYHYGDRNVINSKINVQENLKRNTTLIDHFYNWI